MKLVFRDRRLFRDESLQPMLERCVGFAFSSLKNQLHSLRIDIADVAEARDGKDKRCRVEVILSTRQEIIAEVMDSDFRVAIHRAVDRAGWTTARSLQRARRRASHESSLERRMAKRSARAA